MMSLSAGTKLGRYEIRSKIGEGGMGEVYLAQDTELDRIVAIKILPEHLASDRQRLQRFIQEAKAASALNHPHILTIFEIGSLRNSRYIATEFIDGETLRERMRSERVQLKKALDIAAQIASALAAAHAMGIIHRDIKPENIMLRKDGLVKVLDFGLAKLSKTASNESIDPEALTRAAINTESGIVMGTALYMSPEQARGQQVDERTDIFSLGALIYEMIAGRLPFEGSNTNELIASILNDKEVPPLGRYDASVPRELERIVAKALRKHRDERYQTARDLLLDLESLSQQMAFEAKLERSTPVEHGTSQTGSSIQPSMKTSARATFDAGGPLPTSSAEYVITSIKQHKVASLIAAVVLLFVIIASGFYFLQARKTADAIDSIAVLPLVNENKDPDTEYLSDGLTESLINSLTQVPNLKVIARSSVFRYKGKETDPLVAGKELGVRAVLTGRILQRGDNLTISTELVDVRDNKQIWGEQYNRKVSDLLAVQRDIAREISNNLRLKLSGADTSRLSKQYSYNAEAYQLYLKGRFFINKRTEESTRKAIDYFQQVVANDPNNPLAYTGIADAYAHLVFPLEAVAPGQAMPAARAAATHALAIDDNLSEAHASLAFEVYYYEWNWPIAEREFKRAIELNPNNADAHHWYSHYLMSQHRIDESLAESKRALELSPIDLPLNIHLGWHYLYARQYDLALEQLNRGVEMDSNFAQTYMWLGLVLEQQKKYPEAINAFQKAIALFPEGSTQAKCQMGHAFAVSGMKNEAIKTISELQETAKHRYVSPYQVAAIYAGLGDKDQTFAWLEKAYEERSDWLVNLTNDQRFDELRSDQRFAALVRRVGLPQ